MTGYCLSGYHDDCPDTRDDKGLCTCPCHISQRPGTTASMMESITVERERSWQKLQWLYRISWTTTTGYPLRDTRIITAEETAQYQPGVVPMTTGILDYPNDDQHPCVLRAFAYLIVTEDEVGANQIVARLRVRPPEEIGAPYDEFFLPGGFAESGPNIYPLPIIRRDREP